MPLHRLRARHRTSRRLGAALPLALAFALAQVGSAVALIDDPVPASIVLDLAGDGETEYHNVETNNRLGVDAQGNIYAPGTSSDNVFRIPPVGSPELIMDASGDGTNPLLRPVAVVVDSGGVIYVAGQESNNVFKLAPGEDPVQVIEVTGDGTLSKPECSFPNPAQSTCLRQPIAMAVDDDDNLYVSAVVSHNVFKITPLGVVELIISDDAAFVPTGLDADSLGNLFVSSFTSSELYRRTPEGVLSVVMDINGAERDDCEPPAPGAYDPEALVGCMAGPVDVHVDDDDNVYVASFASNNVWRIPPVGSPVEIIDLYGAPGSFNCSNLYFIGGVDYNPDHPDGCLVAPVAVTTGTDGSVYVLGNTSGNVFRVSPIGAVTEILGLDAAGSGQEEEQCRVEPRIPGCMFLPLDLVTGADDFLYAATSGRDEIPNSQIDITYESYVFEIDVPEPGAFAQGLAAVWVLAAMARSRSRRAGS